MTCLGIEGMRATVYSVSGVSLFSTLLLLVIGIQGDMSGVIDTHKKIYGCAYDLDEFWSE